MNRQKWQFVAELIGLECFAAIPTGTAIICGSLLLSGTASVINGWLIAVTIVTGLASIGLHRLIYEVMIKDLLTRRPKADQSPSRKGGCAR